MNSKDNKNIEIIEILKGEFSGLFSRGDLSRQDKNLVEKWIGKFAKICEEEETCDESN